MGDQLLRQWLGDTQPLLTHEDQQEGEPSVRPGHVTDTSSTSQAAQGQDAGLHPAISPSLPSSWSLPLSSSLPSFPHGSAGLLLPTPARRTTPRPCPSTHPRAHSASAPAAPAHHTARAPGARGTPGALLGCPGVQGRPSAPFGRQPNLEIPAAASSGSALPHHTVSRVPLPGGLRPRPQPGAPAVPPHPLRTPRREPRCLRSPPALTADGHTAQTPPAPSLSCLFPAGTKR